MRVKIPFAELDFSYARSSGPGGQNVNKVNSKAILRWSPSLSATLAALPDLGLRARILNKLAPRLNDAGELVLACDEFRDQPRNRETCIAKLQDLVALASIVPKPRKKTKPTRSSQRKREEGKRHDSEKKRLRGKNWD